MNLFLNHSVFLNANSDTILRFRSSPCETERTAASTFITSGEVLLREEWLLSHRSRCVCDTTALTHGVEESRFCRAVLLFLDHYNHQNWSVLKFSDRCLTRTRVWPAMFPDSFCITESVWLIIIIVIGPFFRRSITGCLPWPEGEVIFSSLGTTAPAFLCPRLCGKTVVS